MCHIVSKQAIARHLVSKLRNSPAAVQTASSVNGGMSVLVLLRVAFTDEHTAFSIAVNSCRTYAYIMYAVVKRARSLVIRNSALAPLFAYSLITKKKVNKTNREAVLHRHS